jgi:hypothetical protein
LRNLGEVKFADESLDTAGSREIVVMKGEKFAITCHMYVGLHIYVSQIYGALKSRHRIFWGVTCATAVREGYWCLMF